MALRGISDALTVGLFMVATYAVTQSVTGRMGCKTLPLLPRHAWKVLAPLMAYRVAQIIASMVIHPACGESLLYKPQKKSSLDEMRKSIVGATRFSVATKGNIIDGVYWKPSDAVEGRYLVLSQGNGDFYEKTSHDFMDVAKKIQAQLVIYNYAGVGRSSGWLPNKERMVASHRAITEMIREKLDATQIIELAVSVGGGVMGQDHFEKPQKKSKAQHILAFYQTFSKTEAVAEAWLGIVGKFAVRLLLGNYNPLGAVLKAGGPVVVFQSFSGADKIIPEPAGLGKHFNDTIRVNHAHGSMNSQDVAEKILEKLGDLNS